MLCFPGRVVLRRHPPGEPHGDGRRRPQRGDPVALGLRGHRPRPRGAADPRRRRLATRASAARVVRRRRHATPPAPTGSSSPRSPSCSWSPPGASSCAAPGASPRSDRGDLSRPAPSTQLQQITRTRQHLRSNANSSTWSSRRDFTGVDATPTDHPDSTAPAKQRQQFDLELQAHFTGVDATPTDHPDSTAPAKQRQQFDLELQAATSRGVDATPTDHPDSTAPAKQRQQFDLGPGGAGYRPVCGGVNAGAGAASTASGRGPGATAPDRRARTVRRGRVEAPCRPAARAARGRTPTR